MPNSRGSVPSTHPYEKSELWDIYLENTCSSARVEEVRDFSSTDWRGKEEIFEKRGLQTAASGVDFESGPVNEMERLQRVADFLVGEFG